MTTHTPTGMLPNGQFDIIGPNDGLKTGYLVGTSGTPSVVLGSAAGTGATFSILGNNLAGQITLTTGISLLGSGTVMTMTLANSFSFPAGMAINFTAGNSNFASLLSVLSVSTTTNAGTLSIATSALSLSTTYIGYYSIMGW